MYSNHQVPCLGCPLLNHTKSLYGFVTFVTASIACHCGTKELPCSELTGPRASWGPRKPWVYPPPQLSETVSEKFISC